ncbi:MAG: hypothetical protein U0572_16220 [Phycisphaerales bacterium]
MALAALAAAFASPAHAQEVFSPRTSTPSAEASPRQCAAPDQSLWQSELWTAGELDALLGPDVELRMASLGEFRLDFQSDDAETAPSAPSNAGADQSTEALAKKLQNPLADLISVPFQFNFDHGYGPKNAGRMTLNIQPVIPISIGEDFNLIIRTILPVIYQGSVADGVDSDFGLGDTTQSFFFSPKEPLGGWIVGAGPVALWPTGTDPQLRTENLGFGPTFVVLRQDHGWTYGMLANQIWSVAHSDDRQEVSSTFIQPFLSYTWPTATSLTLNTETSYDWTGDTWTVPINLMVSQVTKIGDQRVQFQFGGRYYATSPDGGPEWGLRLNVTLLFPR